MIGVGTRWQQHWAERVGPGGYRSKIRIESHSPYTMLDACEMCGFLSTPKKVHARNDCYVTHWHDSWKTGTPHLCCGCWNKFRRVVAKHDAIKTAQRAINALRRAVAIRTARGYEQGHMNTDLL